MQNNIYRTNFKFVSQPEQIPHPSISAATVSISVRNRFVLRSITHLSRMMRKTFPKRSMKIMHHQPASQPTNAERALIIVCGFLGRVPFPFSSALADLVGSCAVGGCWLLQAVSSSSRVSLSKNQHPSSYFPHPQRRKRDHTKTHPARPYHGRRRRRRRLVAQARPIPISVVALFECNCCCCCCSSSLG